MAHYQAKGNLLPRGHPRPGRRDRRPTLGTHSPNNTGSPPGRFDRRRIKHGDRQSQRPRTTPTRPSAANSDATRDPPHRHATTAIRQGDHVAFIAQHRPRRPTASRERQPRRNRQRSAARHLTIALDGSDRQHQARTTSTSTRSASPTPNTSTASKAPPSSAPSSSPAAGKPARRAPTSRPHAPATAPTGTSHATSSATKDKTPTESDASPNTCATAAHRPHPSPTKRHPIPCGIQALSRYLTMRRASKDLTSLQSAT